MAKHRDRGDGIADRDDNGDFTREDGSSYSRVDPAEFDSFDEVDSRGIVDDGAPI